jgi:4-diphosphocytidyl-2-C-methyl-D-erythritol kinase
MKHAAAHAKINLALVVGPTRPDGKHEVATVMQALDLADGIELAPSRRLDVTGFPEDTLVRSALERLAEAAAVAPEWSVRITKRIPVAGGLGGGSSDAAAALRLANETLPEPLSARPLLELASGLGADVPFFLNHGAALATGDGSMLAPLALPHDYHVLLALPNGAVKPSTAAVYAAFDERGGDQGFEERQALLDAALTQIRQAADLALLPPNDLATSSMAAELRRLGAFRADVTGAGPTVYGLFADRAGAVRAGESLRGLAQVWLAQPTW